MGCIGWGISVQGGILNKFSLQFTFLASLLCLIAFANLFTTSEVYGAIIGLPLSTTNFTINRNLPAISISTDSVFFNNKGIGNISIISNFPSSQKDPIIHKLVDEIGYLDGHDSVVVQMDSRHPFQYLFTVMNTCGYLNIHNIFLSVRRQNGRDGSVHLSLARPGFGSNCDNSTVPTIIFSDTCITVGYKFGFLGYFSTKTKDSPQIGRKLDSILVGMLKKYAPSIDRKTITLAFKPECRYLDVIKWLDFVYSFGFSNPQVSKLVIDTSSIVKLSTCTASDRTRKSISDSVTAHLKDLQYLYNERLKKYPKLSGQIVVKFRIAQDGSVPLAQINNSEFKDDTLHQEILAAIKRWKFGSTDKPNDTVEVDYPFLFNK